MFEVKNLSSEEVTDKVTAHCAAGLRKGRSPDHLLVGCGNAELVSQIVLEAITWMDTPEKIERCKKFSHQTLAWVVAVETSNLTRENFSWTAICKIIENAGNAKVFKGLIDLLASTHDYAAHVIGYEPDLGTANNVKISMSRLAKAILWMEAYTFLVEEGFDYNEDRF